MEPFYLSYDEFWEWFNREREPKRIKTSCEPANTPTITLPSKTKKPVRHIADTEASIKYDSRYVIMYGKHRPSKKSKVWEGDGYLTFVNGVAHLSDLRGRILEEPTILDDVDMESVKNLGELMIGNTEVQVVDSDQKKCQ